GRTLADRRRRGSGAAYPRLYLFNDINARRDIRHLIAQDCVATLSCARSGLPQVRDQCNMRAITLHKPYQWPAIGKVTMQPWAAGAQLCCARPGLPKSSLGHGAGAGHGARNIVAWM